MKKLFITGGAGFIGSALIRKMVDEQVYHVINIDKLTYAGNLANLATIADHDCQSASKFDQLSALKFDHPRP